MNKLYYGDNLEILRKYIPDRSVDLIYLDPPFNSKKAYNVIFADKTGKMASAQIQVFEDTWKWSDETQSAFEDIVEAKDVSIQLKEMILAFKSFMGTSQLMTYITMLAVRLVEAHRILKDTGSLYLHCDPAASHYLKILLDQIFGIKNFRNEIIWERSHTRSSISKINRRAHDVILFYTKSNTYTYNIQYMPLSEASQKLYSKENDTGLYRTVPLLVSGKRTGVTGQPWRGIDPNTLGRNGMHWVTTLENLEEYNTKGLIYWASKGKKLPQLKYYFKDNPGVPSNDSWYDIPYVQKTESIGYPTQKPLKLLERIIAASSNPGDVVLDPFCGCGTAIVAAEKIGRNWMGIDITHLAIALIKKRLIDHFPGIAYEVVGEPKSAEDARELFLQSPFQFESWAVSLLGGHPYKSKGGGDSGIDGLLYFKDFQEKFHKIIIEVKGGGYHPKDIRSLASVLQREEAPLGILIALQPPTPGMLAEAAALGKWQMPGSNKKYPVLQLVTIAEILANIKLDLPDTSETLKKAIREIREIEKHPKLFE